MKIEFPVPGSRAVYEQYRELAEIALGMMTRGLRIDRAAVARHIARCHERAERFTKIWEDCAGNIKLGDDGQRQEVKAWYWDKKGCDPQVSLDKNTRKPKLDTNGALMHWLVEDPRDEVRRASAALIGYRKAKKSLSFLVAYDVDRIFPSWNVTGTKGSRWSCSNPNVQQLPSKTVKYDFGSGPEIVAENMKDIIIPEEGMIFVGADYAALELYLQTYLAGASTLLKWIESGQDLHLGNARIFFGEKRIPLDAQKSDSKYKAERTVGKAAFGFSYASTDHVKTVYKNMKGSLPEITEAWVKEARRRYFKVHHEFPAWQEWTKAEINKRGFITTPLMKRRLYLEASRRGFDTALNAQCQITGGDMMHFAMLEVNKSLQICMQVHDSLVCQVPNTREDIKRAADTLKRAMEGPFTINGKACKFVAEPDVGTTYANMIDVSKYLA